MPDWKQYVRKRLRLPQLTAEREAEIIEDLAQQLDDAYRQALAHGLTEADAHAAAQNEITDWNLLAREIAASETRHRKNLGEQAMTSLEGIRKRSPLATVAVDFLADALHALRLSRKSPGFTAVAVLTLALGIGANVAIFRTLDALLLSPLPFPEPDRLVHLWLRGIQNPDYTSIASKPNFLDWREQSRSFEAMAGGPCAWTPWWPCVTSRFQEGEYRAGQGTFSACPLVYTS